VVGEKLDCASISVLPSSTACTIPDQPASIIHVRDIQEVRPAIHEQPRAIIPHFPPIHLPGFISSTHEEQEARWARRTATASCSWTRHQRPSSDRMYTYRCFPRTRAPVWKRTARRTYCATQASVTCTCEGPSCVESQGVMALGWSMWCGLTTCR